MDLDLELDIDSKVALIFVVFAVVIGSINGIMGISSWGAHWGLVLGLLFFYISYRVIFFVLDLEDSSFDASAWNMIKTGSIPYWFLFLVSWILVFTLKFFSP